MRKIPFLSGEKIYLRPLIETDCNGPYPIWFNDIEVCRNNSHHVFPYTMEGAVEFIKQANRGAHHLVLAIISHDEENHIGNISLDEINYINRSAELTIVIGDKKSWGKGYGKEAARLICHHGFNVLNLKRISCGTFENNIGMQKLARYLGMTEEGRRRDAVFKHGRYMNIIEYGILRDEFVGRFKRTEKKDNDEHV